MVYEKVEIVDLTEEGKGVGRYDGKVVFVEDALPGEVVDVEVFKSKKKFDLGVVKRYYSRSEDRQTPKCKHFGVCGGCSLQHLSYEKTLEYKRRWVESSFRKIAALEVRVEGVFPSPSKFHYRNKVVFHGFMVGGIFRLGFYRKGSRSFVDVEECFLLPFSFMELKDFVVGECNKYRLYPKEVVFRVGKDDRVVVSFLGVRDNKSCEEIRAFLLGSAYSISGVVFFGEDNSRVCSSEDGDEDRDKSVDMSAGGVNLLMGINGREFLVSPESFFQVNVEAAGILFRELKNILEKQGREYGRVFDLYCGVGVVGILLSALFKQIIGFEVVGSAVRLARGNAVRNGVVSGEYIVGRVVDFVGSVDFRSGDVVVVDPPRGGLEEGVVDSIVESGVESFVYVGCGLGKVVRDVGRLVVGGFRVEGVFCVDLFPWTGHVECVVLMSKVKE